MSGNNIDYKRGVIMAQATKSEDEVNRFKNLIKGSPLKALEQEINWYKTHEGITLTLAQREEVEKIAKTEGYGKASQYLRDIKDRKQQKKYIPKKTQVTNQMEERVIGLVPELRKLETEAHALKTEVEALKGEERKAKIEEITRNTEERVAILHEIGFNNPLAIEPGKIPKTNLETLELNIKFTRGIMSPILAKIDKKLEAYYTNHAKYYARYIIGEESEVGERLLKPALLAYLKKEYQDLFPDMVAEKQKNESPYRKFD